jgi:membrane protein
VATLAPPNPPRIGVAISLAKQSINAWIDDYAPSMGAALSYYTLFSLAPVLLLAIAVAGLLFGADAARGQIVAQLGGLVGPEGATAIEGLLKNAGKPEQSALASAVGFVTLIIGATSVFAELQSDLDRIWRAPAAAKPSGIWGILRTRLLSFGVVLSIGFLLLVSLVVSAALAAFGKWYGGWLPGWVITLQILNQVISLGFVSVLFAMMYRMLPSVRVEWRDVWYGALATGVLFTIGKYLIGLYLGKAGVASGFGAAGSLVVLLVWVFYSAQIFLLGAEFTWLFAQRHGSHAQRPQPATAGARPQMKNNDRREPLSATPVRPPASTERPRRPVGELAVAALVWLTFGLARGLRRRRS